MEEIIIQRKTGKDFRRVMANVLVKDHYVSIIEFVSNSYDADAENVFITYDSIEDKLIIEDDGEAMNEKELKNFYRLGDSIKVKNPVSEKGRKKIGKFGIATVLLENLANSYNMEICKDGKKIIVNEDFREKKEEGIEYVVEDITSDKRGTKISLTNLKFEEGVNFSIQKLRRKLIWELPNTDSFNIYLNDKKLVRGLRDPLSAYSFEEELPNAGLVKAMFQYFEKSAPVSGIYIYVNGRAVGDPNYFNVHRIGRSLVNRVLGQINADGLQEYISFDRSRFKEDNEAFREVKEWVNKRLREVKKNIFSISRENRAEKVKKSLRESLENVETTLEKIKMDKISYDIEIAKDEADNKRREKSAKKSIMKVKKTNIKLIDRPVNEPMASIDDISDELSFNVNHPFYEAEIMGDTRIAEILFLTATAYTKGEQKFLSGKDDETKILLKERSALFGKYCKEIFGSDSVADVLSRLPEKEMGDYMPYRLYTNKDVRFHIPLITMNRLIKTGIITPRGNGKLYLGKDITEYIKQLSNRTPAAEIMWEYGMTKDVSRQRVEQMCSDIDRLLKQYEDILPYIGDIGKKEPFFLVENDSIDSLLGLYSKDIIRKVKYMDRHLKRHPELMEELVTEDRFVTLLELGTIYGIKPRELMDIFTFSKLRGNPIAMEDKNGTERYLLEDFVKVRETYKNGNTST